MTLIERLQFGNMRQESLLEFQQSDNTIRGIVEGVGSQNKRPNEFMKSYAQRINQMEVAFALKNALANRFKQVRDSIDFSATDSSE